jgi:acetate---CoA ligase (ADP-forming) subunit alpha
LSDIVKQLDYIFKPRSLAVIGASENVTKWGYLMVDRPLKTGFKGKIYPVNSQAENILGLPCYPSVKDVPGPVDLAVITTPLRQVTSVMRECVEKGVKGAVLISAGFAETGFEGKALEDQVLKIARDGGIRFIGPNGMGIWSAAGNLNLAFDTAPKQGQIAFISQSGTFGGYMAEIAKVQGYGLRMFISVGNQADLTAADYIEYLSHDDETKAIILYMEGVKDGRRFMDVCKQAVKSKPVILYKGGTTPAGARATMSHTSSIAGSNIVFQNACRQAGVIRTQEAFQTFEMAVAMLRQPLPRGRRIGIVGTGGQGVVAVDACQDLGLEIPELDNGTAARLMKMLPPHAPLPRNPVDFAGGYRTAMDEAQTAEVLMKLDYIDAVITNVPVNPLVWGIRFDGTEDNKLVELAMKISEEGTRYLCSLPQKYGKPVVCVRWHRSAQKDPFEDMLVESGVPVYDTPEQCARAMYALAKYAEIKKRA